MQHFFFNVWAVMDRFLFCLRPHGQLLLRFWRVTCLSKGPSNQTTSMSLRSRRERPHHQQRTAL